MHTRPKFWRCVEGCLHISSWLLARCWPIVVKFMLLKCVFGRSAFPPLEFGLYGALLGLVHVLIVLHDQVILWETLLMSTEFRPTLHKAKGWWSSQLNPVYKDTTGCQNRLYNRFDNRLYRVSKHPTDCQTGGETGLTTGWMFVYTIQPVVKPAW